MSIHANDAAFQHLITQISDGKTHQLSSLAKTCNTTPEQITACLSKLNIDFTQTQDTLRLQEAFQPLDANTIKEKLPPDLLEHINIDTFNEIGSTNQYLKDHKSLSNNPSFCIAECQTQGRARINRQWHSPFGQNIYFSCAYHLNQPMKNLLGLSLVTSLAVLRTLHRHHFKSDIKIKWPNDILWQNYKLAGNLVETITLSKQSVLAIIGIGINVNMQNTQGNTIERDWASLSHISKTTLDRNPIVSSLIIELLKILDEFQQKGLAPFVEQWQHFDYLRDKTIRVQQGQNSWHGVAHGINEQGYLVLKKANDTMILNTGEPSIYFD